MKTVATISGATATAVIVALDGTPTWQLLRVLALATLTVLAVLALRHLPRRGAGAVQVAAGLPLVAVGVGIAVPHLSKSGPGLLGLAGAVALGAGLVLLATGVHDLVEGTRWWVRVPAVVVVVLLVGAGLLTVGQAVAATNVPGTSVGSATPSDRGLDAEDVLLRTDDDVELSGWYVPSSNGAAVVLLHGAGSTRSAVLDHAEVLASHGYGVLLLDTRGHGRSDGRAMDFGWFGEVDVEAAVTFLVGRAEVAPGRLAVVGLSMGAEQAIGALGADDRLRAAVAEGATNRIAEDKRWLAEEYGWRGSLQLGLERVTYGMADLLSDAGPPPSLADSLRQAAPRRVLLIAGGDVPDEVSASEWLHEASPESVEVWVAPDSGHTRALDDHPDEWAERVTSFLDDALDV